MKTRVIPCLLVQNSGLVKTVKFRNPTYVGDPINVVRIFNLKEVDELFLLDIDATRRGQGPDFRAIADIASEAFMPVAYGGGVSTIEQAERLLHLGIEKVVVNSVLADRPQIVDQIAKRFGSQSVIVSIDAQRTVLGRYDAKTRNAQENCRRDPVDYAREMESRGAGEILLTSVNRDGTGTGYDTSLIRSVAAAVLIPVIACGGASHIQDFAEAVAAGASAVAASSMFVFHGPYRAVLITYPERSALEALLP